MAPENIHNGKIFVLGVIPARGGSIGVPGKNILPVAGRPVIHHTLAAAVAARLLDNIVVSTDSPLIKKSVSEFGNPLIRSMDRPVELAKSESPIQEALWHAVQTFEMESEQQVGVIVWMSANIPHRKPGLIDTVIKQHIDSGVDSVASVSPVKDHPLFIKRLSPDGLLVPFLEGGHVYRRQDVEPLFAVDGAVVSIKREVLEASLGSSRSHAYLGQQIGYVVQESRYNTELDEPEDLELLEDLIRGAESRS